MASGDGEFGGEARRRREEALRSLAEGAAAQIGPTHAREEQRPLLTATLNTPPRRGPRWLIPAISGVVLLAVIALVVAHFLPGPTARRAPTAMALDPETLGIACLEGVAWSPDGSRLAVLGSRQGCNASPSDSGNALPHVVMMVDAASGKSVSQILPDVSVQLAIKRAGQATPQPVLYSGVIWSPDGKRLALPFTIFFPGAQPGTGGTGVLMGVCVAASDGSTSQTYLQSFTDPSTFSGEWNLKTGKPILRAPISNQVTIVGQLTLAPAALRYAWQPDGTLSPSGLLNATSAPPPAPLASIGNPDGGASFTIWQQMQIAPNPGSPNHPISPPPFEGDATFLAWSPDGTYLADIFAGPWRFLPSKQPVPGPTQLKASFTAKMPLLPIRDAALDAALNGLTGKQSITSNNEFTWSPNGRMLSAFRQVSGDKTILTILDCATGKTLASVTLTGSSNASTIPGNGSMQWSPDGKRLLVMSGAELFIVGTAALSQG